MSSSATCAATIVSGTGDLACVLAAAHQGPVHRDSSGNEWGDPALQTAAIVDQPDGTPTPAEPIADSAPPDLTADQHAEDGDARGPA